MNNGSALAIVVAAEMRFAPVLAQAPATNAALEVVSVTQDTLPAAQPAPKFAVVSIKARRPGSPLVVLPNAFTPDQPGGRFVMPVAAVVQLIAFAYDVKLSRVIGLPASISGSYEVSAKAADDFPLLSFDENRKQVRLMVRQMLADRFGLRLHTEFRQETVLKMSVDPGGLRLAESSAPLPSPTRDRPTNLGMSDRGGRMIGRKATMKDIALSAGTLLRQEVVDTTGLTGQYDFDIRWTAPSVPNAPPPSPTLGPDGMALFMTAMKDQFGLRFSKSNEQVQYLIVDRITPPAEN